MDFQIIKLNGLDEIVLRESGLVMALEVLNGGIQPDRFTQVKLIAYFLQGTEYLVGARIVTAILNHSVFDHMIVLEFLSP